MKTKYIILLSALIILLPINFGLGFFLGYKISAKNIQTQGPFYLPREAIVEKVVDGDTIEIRPVKSRSNNNFTIPTRSVRYLGIDAPNLGDNNYQKSKKYNENLVLGKTITLEYDTPQNDKYGRILAWIWLDKKLINKEMINAGLAVPYQMENQKLKYDLFSSSPDK